MLFRSRNIGADWVRGDGWSIQRGDRCCRLMYGNTLQIEYPTTRRLIKFMRVLPEFEAQKDINDDNES